MREGIHNADRAFTALPPAQKRLRNEGGQSHGPLHQLDVREDPGILRDRDVVLGRREVCLAGVIVTRGRIQVVGRRSIFGEERFASAKTAS